MRMIMWLLLVYSTVSSVFAQEAPDPDPNRFADSFAAFAQQDKDHPFAKGGIVFVGSSSVRMLDIPRYFPGIVALNRGFGGAHISDIPDLQVISGTQAFNFSSFAIISSCPSHFA